ncbi:hypothetical protein KAS79_02525, partial [Candidatus Parcubacteria bacterium]|nr:hypothetical protein [Candidatus Parcubacteria bacterium]
KAFVEFLRKYSDKSTLKIAVGRDNRASSLPLFKALAKGIMDQGADVVDIGHSASPMLYFAVGYYELDGGVEITASHNPVEYNGFKVVREKTISVSGETGLEEIKKLMEKFIAKKVTGSKKRGKIIKKRIISDYVKFVVSDFDFQKIKPFKIVVALPKNLPSEAVRNILAKLPCKIYYSNCSKADLKIAFDGDGDRIIFTDERGAAIPSDVITAVISEIILRKNSGKKILYDICSSNIVKETIEKNKGIAIKGRVGHSLIKEKMRKENIFFAGEYSGHYYLKTHYFCESPFFVLFKILEEMSEKKNKLSEIVKPYEIYHKSKKIRFLRVKDSKKIFKILEKKYKNGKIFRLDGLRIDFKDWWFNIRASNTEPILKLVIEAKTKVLLEKKQKEITKIVSIT